MTLSAGGDIGFASLDGPRGLVVNTPGTTALAGGSGPALASLAADAGDFREVTRRINGGYNGLSDRQRLHDLAQKHLATGAGLTRAFLRDGGGNRLMEGETEDYLGTPVTRLPDGRLRIGTVILTVYPDRAVQLDPATAQPL